MKARIVASILFVLIAAAPVAAQGGGGCGWLCWPAQGCTYAGGTNWYCGNPGPLCYDDWCGASRLTDEQITAIADAAKAGNMAKAAELAAGHPFLRISDAAGLVFDGPAVAGIAKPGASREELEAVRISMNLKDCPAVAADLDPRAAED